MSNGVGPVSGEANIQNIDPQFNKDSDSSGLSYEEVAALHAAVSEEGSQVKKRSRIALQSIVAPKDVAPKDDISSVGHPGLKIQSTSPSSSGNQVDWSALETTRQDFKGINEDISASIARHFPNGVD